MLALCLACFVFSASGGAYAEVPSVFRQLVDFLGETLGMPQQSDGSIDVQIVSDGMPDELYPGAEVVSTLAVKNQGNADAYFRFAVALRYDAQTWNRISVRFAADGYAVSDWMDVRICGEDYRMKVFSYEQELPDGQTSPGIGMTVSVDEKTTLAQIAAICSDFIQMKALAIETRAFKDQDGTMTAGRALDMALPLDENFNPF